MSEDILGGQTPMGATDAPFEYDAAGEQTPEEAAFDLSQVDPAALGDQARHFTGIILKSPRRLPTLDASLPRKKHGCRGRITSMSFPRLIRLRPKKSWSSSPISWGKGKSLLRQRSRLKWSLRLIPSGCFGICLLYTSPSPRD